LLPPLATAQSVAGKLLLIGFATKGLISLPHLS
jgi:hypothetical protein